MTDSLAEADHWIERVTTARRTQLQRVQAAAGNWSTLLTTLLGLFGVASFVGGTNGLDDLTSGWATVTKAGVTVALVLLVVASAFAASAAGRLAVRRTSDSTWRGFRDREQGDAERAARHLRWAKWSGAAAALVVLAGAVTILWLDAAPSRPPQVFVTGADGPRCGRLARSAEGRVVVMTPSGPAEIGPDASVTVVSTCP